MCFFVIFSKHDAKKTPDYKKTHYVYDNKIITITKKHINNINIFYQDI